MSIEKIEKWGVFELSLQGPTDGNPYLDVTLKAVLTCQENSQGENQILVPGFYDGNGVYKVRFMPEVLGTWHFQTVSNIEALNEKVGKFESIMPSENNHGPVRVKNQFHFAYADGKPFLSFGTTCYAWTHQPESEQEKTLQTLAQTKFNKVRMGVFPKDYPYNENEALHDIFLKEQDVMSFDSPNYAAFQHLDKQIVRLQGLGIEADLIMFHPYDRWGYCNMSLEQDNRYVTYLAARYAAYRNVWWALANEFDFLLDTKPMSVWDNFFKILEDNDPYHHLKSIHNGEPDANYDHTKPWVTHTCIQNWDVKRTVEWRNTWGKPVINDEPEYEGNLIQAWGNITAQELTHRFWITMLKGGYAGHGETYTHKDDLIWWAKGGVLHGEAWKRLGFLRDLLEQDVVNGFEPLSCEEMTGAEMTGAEKYPWNRISGAIDGDVRYLYFGEHQPEIWALGLPKQGTDYDLELIDTWNMTITKIDQVPAPENHPIRHGEVMQPSEPDAAFAVKLPRKSGLAIRCKKRV